MQVQYTALKTNHIQSVVEKERIEERSSRTSQPSYVYATINNLDCCVGWLLFGCLYFCMGILLYDKTLQVQKISQKSTRPKLTQLDQIDNRSYSTIQPLAYPTYILKIGVWPTILEFFGTFNHKSIRTAHQNSHQILKKLNISHLMGSSSPVTNPSGAITNINVT